MAFAGPGKPRLHSLPSYHGWYVALWALIPALLFLVVWSSLSGGLVTQAVLDSPAAATLPTEPMQRGAVPSEARGLASGAIQTEFNTAARTLAPAYEEAHGHYDLLGRAPAHLPPL